MKKELELYVHIPFCVRKCAYCDFLSFPADGAARQEYINGLIREITCCREAFREYRVSTVFMGGGTPSILTCRQVEEIFRALYDNFTIEKDAEITIEANPGTVDAEKVTAWKQAGINRISIGLQSVNNEELKLLGRIHTFQQFSDTYRLVREQGFRNVNIDLISAIPGQTLDSWRKTLRTAAELAPEHLSAYSLIIEPGTPFYEKYGDIPVLSGNGSGEEDAAFGPVPGEQKKAGQQAGQEAGQQAGQEAGQEAGQQAGQIPALPDEDTDRAIYEETEKILREYGYGRYEISNYAKPGYECRHNIGYWKRTEYLGLGLGASSLIQRQRFHNTTDLKEYLENIKKGRRIRKETETLSRTDEMEEFMFLGLRMTEGIRINKFQELFGKSIEEVYKTPLLKMRQAGLLEMQDGSVRLTKRGIDISNYVFEQFLL